MNFIFLLLILLAALSLGAEAQERTVVATVDSAPIYLDQIGGAPAKQEGEIKFVDPGGAQPDTSIENQITVLKKRIKDEILRIEIEKRAIDPPEDVVAREVDAYAEQQWRLLFPNEAKQKEVLSRMQLTGLKILEGLTIWKQDSKKGDEFAKLELEPLGMDEAAWAFYTDHADDPEILQKLKKWEDIDNMSREEIKEFLFLTKNEDHRNNIKFILAKEMLKQKVAPEVSVSRDETRRLYRLINNTQWIDIIIIPGNDKVITRLSEVPKEDRYKALSEELKSRQKRLPRSDAKDGEHNISTINEYMIIAAYTQSLEPGTMSSVIKWPGQDGKLRDFVIFIVYSELKDTASSPQEYQITEMSKALQKFKSDQAFEQWLNQEIPQRTKILIPEYSEAVRN